MIAPTFLYCIEITGHNAGKVGITNDPHYRLTSVRCGAPFPMRFRHVFRIGDRRHAAGQERRILSLANRYRKRGEWVVVDDTLDRLFASVPQAENVTEEFVVTSPFGRYDVPPAAAEIAARKALMTSKIGAEAVARAAYTGSEAGFDETLIRARLADGYGVEDILATDGIPIEASRAVIAQLEAAGKLHGLLHAYRLRAAAE